MQTPKIKITDGLVGLNQLKKPNHLIGIRTRNLPACSMDRQSPALLSAVVEG
jgi:hypothetical protein